MSKLKLTQWEQRTVSDLMSIEVDTDVLKKCTPSFEGETVEEIIEFFQDLEMDIEEFTEDNKEILGEDYGNELYEFYVMADPAEAYYDSSHKYRETEIVDGEDDLRAWEFFMNRNN